MDTTCRQLPKMNIPRDLLGENVGRGKPAQPQQHKVLFLPEQICPHPDLTARPQLCNGDKMVMPISSLLVTHIHLSALPILPEESRLFLPLV